LVVDFRAMRSFGTTFPARRLPGAALLAALALALSAAGPEAKVGPGENARPKLRISHAGELLVASPAMPDPRFRESVVLLLQHDEGGALGLIVNRVLARVKPAELFAQHGLEAPAGGGEVEVHYGGPVDPDRGFVLHSAEGSPPPLIRVNERVGVSPVEQVLRAMARGEGPRRAVFMVGYAGWGPGQLEEEMRRGAWFTAPADEDILFDPAQATKWRRAMERRFRTL